jgi:GNAT superfamily N-acetyltransferase
MEPLTTEAVVLEDGTEASVRSITPEDAPALVQFHSQLSQLSVRMRFFGLHSTLSAEEVRRFTHVDGTDRVALVLEAADELVAVGRYERLDDPCVAEVAFVVADAFQHRGIGSFLLTRLAARAREAGITIFSAEVLAENRPMRSVFAKAGFPTKVNYSYGTVSVTMDIGQPSCSASVPV